MTKAKKPKRKTLAERLEDSRVAGLKAGYAEGAASIRREFGPDPIVGHGVRDFLRMVDSWNNMSGDAVIMISGTDLKHHSTGAMPIRLCRALAEQLRRLGYSTAPNS